MSSVLAPKRKRVTKSIEVRLMAKTVRQSSLNPCWEWKGALNNKGYGIINRGRVGEGIVLVHRLSYEIHKDKIPHGINVCHKCDNPPCINPDHLFLGTQAQNMADAVAKGRTATPWNAALNKQKTHCVHGHLFSEDNTFRDRGGWRQCRTCRRDYKKRRRSKAA